MGPHDVATAVLCIGMGLVAVALGLNAYTTRNPRRQAWISRTRWMTIGTLYLQIPGGMGFILVGIGILIARHPFTDLLLLGGMGILAIGCILIFWHPDWVRPVWLRGPLGD